jgi:hypothetical protein
MKKDTLKKGIKILIVFAFLFFFACKSTKNEKTKKLTDISTLQIGKENYSRIYSQANDSILTWSINKLDYFKFLGTSKNYYLDSLLCFDVSGSRLVGCILSSHKDEPSGGIDFLYGEKIDNQWYFFTGAYIVVPISMFKDNKGPLSYKQLHEIALKEVYPRYLQSNGEINEEWFTSHFENAGFCSECKTREDFQKSILEGVGALWTQRDTTQPIKRLEKDNKMLP